MNVIEAIHSRITTTLFSFDDFDKALLDFLLSRLSDKNRHILSSQMSLINKSQTEFDEETSVLTNYFYRMFFGSSIRNFPEVFPHSERSELLARLRVDVNEQVVIHAELMQVDGVFFCIRYTSSSDLSRPLSPDFKITVAELPEAIAG